MWNALKSLLDRVRNRGNSDPVFDEVRALVEDLLTRKFSDRTERRSNDEQVVSVLERLDTEIESIRTQANGYPNGSISALVWMRGAGYADLCRRLTLADIMIWFSSTNGGFSVDYRGVACNQYIIHTTGVSVK